MEKKNKKKESKSPSVNNSLKTELEKQENTRPETYVVLRDGYRVSHREYASETDPLAISEQEFWGRVARFHSWGETVEIVKYDNRKHRVWDVE